MITYTITFGNLLEILTIGLGGLFFIWELRSKLQLLQYSTSIATEHLNRLDLDFKELAKVTITIAQQSERLNGLDARITEISSVVQLVSDVQKQRIQAVEDLRNQMHTKFDNANVSIAEIKDKLSELHADITWAKKRKPRAA